MIDHFKYTDKELVELISSMVILIDTREKNLWMKQFLDSLETISNKAQV